MIAEPTVAPVPLGDAPIEAADIQAAKGIAVDRPQEVDVAGVASFIHFPVIRDEVWVGNQVVREVGIERGFRFQLRAQLVTFNGLATFLVLGQMEPDFRRVPFELADPGDVLFELEVARNERVSGEVNHVSDDVDLAGTADDRQKLGQTVSLGEPFDVGRCQFIAVGGMGELEEECSARCIKRVFHGRVFLWDVDAFFRTCPMCLPEGNLCRLSYKSSSN